MTDMTEFTEIEVPDAAFTEARFRAHLVGASPLLMHSTAGMQAASNTVKRSGTEVPPPDVEAEQGAYRLPTGELYVPATAVRGSMYGAGVFYQDPNYKKGTMQKPVGAGLMAPVSEGFILLDGDGEPITDYAIDTRRVVLGTGKSAKGVVRSRARIELVIDFDLYPRQSVDATSAPTLN